MEEDKKSENSDTGKNISAEDSEKANDAEKKSNYDSPKKDSPDESEEVLPPYLPAIQGLI